MEKMRSMPSLFTIFVPIIVSNKAVSAIAARHGNDYDLIIKDFKQTTSRNDVDVAKDASFDCWMDALNTLETNTFPSDDTSSFHEQLGLSPGGNFCALLRSGYGSLDALAFLLTKCEYEKFSEPLPKQCTLSEGSGFSVDSNGKLRECMLSLPNDTWLGVWTAFTQYKLSSYNICLKLTDELMLHRQREAALHLERTMVDMEGKIDNVLLKADMQIEGTIATMSNRIEEMRKDVKDDMKDMMNMELKNVQHIHEEIRGVLNKADDKFEETTKKMENYVHTKLFELYENSGLNKILGVTSRLMNLSKTYTEWWSILKVLFRLMILLVMLSMVLPRTESFRPARSIMIVLTILELSLDLTKRYSGELLNVYNIQQTILKSVLRFVRYVIEAVVFATTLLRSFQTNEDKDENAEEGDQKVRESFGSALESVKIQIETDRRERRVNEDQWKQIALMSLQKHTHPSGDLMAMTPQQYSTPRLHHNLYTSPPVCCHPQHYPPIMTPKSSDTNEEMKQCLNLAFSQEQHSTYQFDVISGMVKNASSNLSVADDTSLAYETASEGGRVSFDSIATCLKYDESKGNEEPKKKRIKVLENGREGILGVKRKALLAAKEDGSMNEFDDDSCTSPLKKQKQT